MYMCIYIYLLAKEAEKLLGAMRPRATVYKHYHWTVWAGAAVVVHV